ncbi:protein FAM180A [Salarias fasciatus]|uniref:protein FAM180A n=1 Tax=Salarias fasciatus TaxID=181472 RepID=UPI001176DECD|nr:protein FAM180A-like [Salarias fasciatus]
MDLDVKNLFQILFWLCFEHLLQDVTAGSSQTSQKAALSVRNANLMFEFLLGGVQMDQDNNIVLLDGEMASMRQGRAFLSQINDNIPRSLNSMIQMASELEDEKKKRPLTEAQFENLVLSLVYSAHQALHQKKRAEREAWGEVLFQLANITVHEIRGSYLFNYA